MLFTHGHALLIGVGSYAHSAEHNVPITADDARAVADVLRDQQLCGYPAGQVTLLHDTAATRDGILVALDTLARRTTTDDTLLVFYSGHGIIGDDGRYYLTTHDSRFIGSQILAGTGVSDREFLDALKQIPAERMLLVFNACHAGHISPTLAGPTSFTGQTLSSQTTAALLSTGSGRIIITACREKQYSYIGEGDYTIFAQALLDGLRGKDTSSRSGFISAFDLYAFIYQAVGVAVQHDVPESLRKQYSQTQEPELTVLKGVGPFAVALYQGAPALGNVDPEEAPPTQTAVHAVSLEESRASFQQIQSGGINFGQRNTVTISGDIVAGNQRTIRTGGGDYAEGNIDNRQGVFIEGGSSVIGGTIVGVNQGTLTIGDATRASASSPLSLESVLAQVQEAVGQTRQRGDDDLADDLDGVARALQAALKAQNEGKPERQATKVREASETLQRIAEGRGELARLVKVVRRLR